ncbi:hypothetical protein SLS56_005573 [Neofusicoccum ribis]|uniref:Nephrocystin 3-like N-terminal domain-containing protein n=1 Tax=Neofusicoccum ribis TaxID=45134 RepID=A0ABR3SUV1_9PEZI
MPQPDFPKSRKRDKFKNFFVPKPQNDDPSQLDSIRHPDHDDEGQENDSKPASSTPQSQSCSDANPFLKSRGDHDAAILDDVVKEVDEYLKESWEEFKHKRDREGMLKHVRNVFEKSYNAVTKIIDISKLGLEIASASFKSVSEYFDKIMQFFDKTADIFQHLLYLGQEFLGPKSENSLVWEPVEAILTTVLKICAHASKELESLFKTWAGVTFRGGGKLQEELDKMVSEKNKLNEALSIILSKDARKLLQENAVSREILLQIESKQDDNWNRFWNGVQVSEDGTFRMTLKRTSKDPAARQDAEFLELQQRVQDPDQLPLREEYRQCFVAHNDWNPSWWNGPDAINPNDSNATKSGTSETTKINSPRPTETNNLEVINLDSQGATQPVDGPSGTKLRWIIGPGGVGKSYYAYNTFMNLEKISGNNVAMFFFRADREAFRGLRAALASMVGQIAARNPEFCHKALTRLRKHEDLPNNDVLWKLLVPDEHPIQIHLLFDGVDEASKDDRAELVHLLSKLPVLNDAAQGTSPPIRILLTSRSAEDDEISRLKAKKDTLSPSRMRDFFELYCEGQIQRMPRLSKFNSGLRRKIALSLSNQADGMLYIENMLFRLDMKGFESAVLKDMENLPRTLDEVYSQMLEDSLRGLDNEQIRTIQALLTWLAFAFRPVSIQEAIDITGILFKSDKSFVLEDEIFRRFSGEPNLQPKDSRTDIRMGLFASHLLILDMGTHLLCRKKTEPSLLSYAACFWFDHFLEMCKAAPEKEDIKDLYRVTANLASVLSNSGNFAMKFETHASKVYSKIRSGKDRDLPVLIACWFEKAKNEEQITNSSTRDGWSSPYEGAKENRVEPAEPSIANDTRIWGRDSCIVLDSKSQAKLDSQIRQWLVNMGKNPASKALSGLARGHGDNWLAQTTPSAVAGIYKFASDALSLTIIRGPSDKDRAISVRGTVERLQLKAQAGKLDLAIGLAQESLDDFDEAIESFEKGLSELFTRRGRYSCLMGLFRWQHCSSFVERGIEKADGAHMLVHIVDWLIQDENFDMKSPQKETVIAFLRWKRDALLQRAQCHSSRNLPEDRAFVLDLISRARKTPLKEPMEGFVLNQLAEAFVCQDGEDSESFTHDFQDWSDYDKRAWMQWIIETNDSVAFGRLRNAAVADVTDAADKSKMDSFFTDLKKVTSPFKGTRSWSWAQLKIAMLHRSLRNDDKTAKDILLRLLNGKYRHRSSQVLYDARLVLSDILYEEFRKLGPAEPQKRTNVVLQMENIPKLDRTCHVECDLDNSLASINLARVHRILGNFEKYESILRATFMIFVKTALALSEDQRKTDFGSNGDIVPHTTSISKAP